MPQTPQCKVNLRSLAQSLGLSRTTVSDAMRGSTRVNGDTRDRVRAAATAAGYKYNPLAGAVMSALRRSNGRHFRGVLAVVEMDGPVVSERQLRERELLIGGIELRATELGFKIERHCTTNMRVARLKAVFHARNIEGLIVISSQANEAINEGWSGFTAVYIGNQMGCVLLPNVFADHCRSMIRLLYQLRYRGYSRPGLVLEQEPHEHSAGWARAFSHHDSVLTGCLEIPVLTSLTRGRFQRWFAKYNPDVVLGESSTIRDWMSTCGAKIPWTHSFIGLDSLATDIGECAALDFRTEVLGARAVELLANQLLPQSCHELDCATAIAVLAVLREGNTLRSRLQHDACLRQDWRGDSTNA